MTTCHPEMYLENLHQYCIPPTYVNKEQTIFNLILNHLDKLLWKRADLQFTTFYVHINFKIVYKYLL